MPGSGGLRLRDFGLDTALAPPHLLLTLCHGSHTSKQTAECLLPAEKGQGSLGSSVLDLINVLPFAQPRGKETNVPGAEVPPSSTSGELATGRSWLCLAGLLAFSVLVLYSRVLGWGSVVIGRAGEEAAMTFDTTGGALARPPTLYQDLQRAS